MIRNTAFTAVAVVLTALGLRWHGLVAQAPLVLNAQAVALASQNAETSPDFPLKISFNAPQVHLGQTETVTVATLPGAQLDVVTQYPDGSTNNTGTFQLAAGASGRLSFNVTIADFHNLGLVRISAVATISSKTTQAIDQFQVTPWQLPGGGQPSDYQFPLAP